MKDSIIQSGNNHWLVPVGNSFPSRQGKRIISAADAVQESVADVNNRGLKVAKRDYRKTSQITSSQMVVQGVLSALERWEQIVFRLKLGLDNLGVTVIYELLDKSYNDFNLNIEAISDVDTIRLSRDLGYLSPAEANNLLRFRETAAKLKQRFKRNNSYSHFTIYSVHLKKFSEVINKIYNQPIVEIEGTTYEDFSVFDSLRTRLTSSEPLSLKDRYLIDIQKEPYAIKRTALRLILGLVKTSYGTTLNNVLSNALVFISSLWDNLSIPDKYQVGRCYSDLVNEGRTTAAGSMKHLLIKVRGLDYVPSSFRANYYSMAADAILDAHFSKNGYFTEIKPIQYLQGLGTEIPKSVLSKCLTALLCVELGSIAGVSPQAKDAADAILENLSSDKWDCFFNDCLLYEERLLDLLRQWHYANSWLALRKQFRFNRYVQRISDPGVKSLLKSTKEEDVIKFSDKFYRNLIGKSH